MIDRLICREGIYIYLSSLKYLVIIIVRKDEVDDCTNPAETPPAMQRGYVEPFPARNIAL